MTRPVDSVLASEVRFSAVSRDNRSSFERIACRKRLPPAPGAGHIFEESGAFGEVVGEAGGCFGRHLGVPA